MRRRIATTYVDFCIYCTFHEILQVGSVSVETMESSVNGKPYEGKRQKADKRAESKKARDQKPRFSTPDFAIAQSRTPGQQTSEMPEKKNTWPSQIRPHPELLEMTLPLVSSAPNAPCNMVSI